MNQKTEKNETLKAAGQNSTGNRSVGKRTTTRKKPASKKKLSKTNTGKQTKRRFKKTIRWAFLILSLIISLTVLAVVLGFNFKYGDDIKQFESEAEQLVNQSNLDTFRQSETSLVYDKNEKLVSTLKGEKDVYYLEYNDIPEYVTEAMISIEDKKFMKHVGVDIKANIRAMLALLQNRGDITQGASTITQQLARNIFLSNEVSWERKIKEMLIAVELEDKYTKNQIMEFYLNNIYFANGYYGIQAASKGYFSKGIEELSLSQIAFLCAIPNNPTIYNPMVNPDNTKKRRDRILLQMYKDGIIDREEYETACNEEIELVQIKVSKNNYVETYVYYCAARALMEQQGFEFRNDFTDKADREAYDEKYYELYNQCQKSLYYEGYRIYTSFDLNKQKKLQNAVNDTLADYTEKDKDDTYSLQGAAVSVDNETGRVVAIVGGRYQESTGYTLNRGYQSFRQPGSAIKPLIVYTPSFERGYYPDDLVVDKAFKDGPTNSNGVYSGKIELRRAVELSKNTIAWKLFEELTPKIGLSYLLEMNFAKIDKNDYYPAASLGGFTTGASPLEMTAAFATLENDGIYREPTCIIKILDSKGEEIVGETTSEKRIFNSNAARMMTDVLTGVIKNGTGKGLGLDNMSSAGKTGTTSEKKDGWFVGYTPYYTTGVWVGYDIPKQMNELSGASFPGTIWNKYMSAIHKKLKNKEFTPFDDNRTPAKQTSEETITNESEEVDNESEWQDSLEEGYNSEEENTEEDMIDNSDETDESYEDQEDFEGDDDIDFQEPVKEYGDVEDFPSEETDPPEEVNNEEDFPEDEAVSDDGSNTEEIPQE